MAPSALHFDCHASMTDAAHSLGEDKLASRLLNRKCGNKPPSLIRS